MLPCCCVCSRSVMALWDCWCGCQLQAYKKLSLIYHPDKMAGLSKEERRMFSDPAQSPGLSASKGAGRTSGSLH